MANGYLTLKELSEYSRLSVRTLRRHIRPGCSGSLPYIRLGGKGKILINIQTFDNWMSRQEIGSLEDTAAWADSVVNQWKQDMENLI